MPSSRLSTLARRAAALLAAVWLASAAHAQGDCNSPVKGLDYRNERHMLQNVEGNHFTPNIEMLLRGNTGSVSQELSYVLLIYPNHPRALVSLVKLAGRQKTDQPPGATFSVLCYFERALRFRPDDAVVRMLFAQYLGGKGRKDEAITHLDRVVANAGDNPLTHYNAGLLYADLQVYDKALKQAHVAMEMGFPRPDLSERLKAANKWSEPAPTAVAQDAAPAASEAAKP